MSDPVPWSFAVGGEMTEQLEWETDALAAETGPEQSRRLRAFPRVQLRFDGLETGARRRWLEATLRSAGGGQWYVPLAMDARQLSVAAPSGSDTLATDTDFPRFVAGGYALLQGEDPRGYEVVEVQSVLDGALSLVGETVRDWPVGTRISPARLGRLGNGVGLSRFTADITGVYQAQFRLDEPIEQLADAGAPTYRSYPVLEWRPAWTADPTWAADRTLITSDEGVAPAFVFDPVRQARDRVALQFALEDVAQIQAFRSLLYALGGRWAPVWVPSWTHDLRVVANVNDGATVLDVEGPLLSAFPLASNRRDLRIELVDGTVLYRRVTAAVAQTFTMDRLTLDAPIATGFSAAAVAMVSFLVLSRQDSDVNLLRYFDWQTAQCELTFKGEVHAL